MTLRTLRCGMGPDFACMKVFREMACVNSDPEAYSLDGRAGAVWGYL